MEVLKNQEQSIQWADNTTKDITIRRNNYIIVNFCQGQVGDNKAIPCIWFKNLYNWNKIVFSLGKNIMFIFLFF